MELGLQAQSLVSFWKSQHSTSPDQFECSGVFVGERLILTAGHAVDNGRKLWVRPQVDALQSYSIVGEAVVHKELDAALVRIEFMPPGSRAAELDYSGQVQEKQHMLSLNGYFDGNYEVAQPTQWVSFRADDRRHIIGVKQPKGHSGSGLAHGTRLWGIAVSHYADANTHRGCVVSLGQLWDEWLGPELTRAGIRHVGVGDIPRHDVPRRAADIRAMIASNDVGPAVIKMLDLVQDFRTQTEEDRAVELSMRFNDLERRDVAAAAAMKVRTMIVREMLKLLSDLEARLREDAGRG